MENIEKHFPALREIVAEYDSLKKKDKLLIPILIIGSIISVLFPPAGIPFFLLFCYWAWSWYKYGYYLCPRCNKYYFSWYQRWLVPITSNSRYWVCKKCGLKVCELPEIECPQKPASHKEEWLQ